MIRRYRNFLRSKKLQSSTIEAYIRRVHIFIQWSKDQQLELRKIKYHHIISYIDHQKSKGLSVRTINHDQVALRYYFESLGIKNNPSTDIHIKGTPRNVINDLLNEQQLLHLYDSYPSQTDFEQRDKVMIGLLTFQGLTTGEIALLHPHHIDLKKATITIPQRATTNKRILCLHPSQIIEFHSYLTIIRPILNNQRENSSQLLFITTSTGSKLHNTLQRTAKKLRRNHPYFKDYLQLRASVITHWLKKDNLREVQYKSGHRYISSTERYQRADVSELKNELVKFDPMS